MYVAFVIPFTSLFGKDTLTYFTGKKVAVGDMVLIPIRNKLVHGLVVDVITAQEAKATLRSADYTARKIESVIGPSPFTEALIAAATDMSVYTTYDRGSILAACIPQQYLTTAAQLPVLPHQEKEAALPEVYGYQALIEDRLLEYKTLIRESFARKQSVLILTPTHGMKERFIAMLQHGITQRVVHIPKTPTKKQWDELWHKVVTSEHPLLIIGTPQLLSLPIPRLGLLIIEGEHHHSYNTQRAPHINLKQFAERYAYHHRIKCILADTVLSIETRSRITSGGIQSIGNSAFRRLPTKHMIKVAPLTYDGTPKGLFSGPLYTTLAQLTQKKEHLFIYCSRKGLAPTTTCQDCGTVVTCTLCSAPLVLYTHGTFRKYSCNRCGNTESAERTCTHCLSWRLAPLGIGTQRVQEAVQTLFPELPCTIVDKEHVTTPREAHARIAHFLETPYGVLIGTDFAKEQLPEAVDKVAVISLDTLFAIPSYRMNETLVTLLFSLSELSHAPVLVQTKNSEEPLLKAFTEQRLDQWEQEEIHDRLVLEYPPYGLLIKLSYQGNKKTVQEIKKLFEALLQGYTGQLSAGFRSKEKDQYAVEVLLKLRLTEWPSLGEHTPARTTYPLYDRIRSLPIGIRVEINPTQSK